MEIMQTIRTNPLPISSRTQPCYLRTLLALRHGRASANQPRYSLSWRQYMVPLTRLLPGGEFSKWKLLEIPMLPSQGFPIPARIMLLLWPSLPATAGNNSTNCVPLWKAHLDQRLEIYTSVSGFTAVLLLPASFVAKSLDSSSLGIPSTLLLVWKVPERSTKSKCHRRRPICSRPPASPTGCMPGTKWLRQRGRASSSPTGSSQKWELRAPQSPPRTSHKARRAFQQKSLTHPVVSAAKWNVSSTGTLMFWRDFSRRL
mmetsp:Transcript_5360/g.12722  ORF Transcript_5360/g.12722 Transcript_5360/m.12722 type:complete len:258 (-) Transcript_5360:1183-1956(-)